MGKHSLFDLYLGRFRKFYFQHRIIPAFSQCMEVIGVNSKSVVHRFFQQMLDYGYLLKKQGTYYPGERLMSLPLFESVRAGVPTEASSEVSEQISVESYLIEHPEHTVLLSVKGDSMQDAGLQEQDIVIVDTSLSARVGNVVIAIVDQEYTVKYLQKDTGGTYYLEPANTNYENIYPEQEMNIFGVVVGSFRKY